MTFVLTGSSSSTIGSLTITGETTFDFTAPQSGDFAGIIVYQDRNAPLNTDNRITGNSEVTIDGSFYFPRQEIVVTGGATVSGDDECANFVGRDIRLSGNSVVQIECDTDATSANTLATGQQVALLRM